MKDKIRYKYNIIPHSCILDFSNPDRGIAKRATSPPAMADIAATAKAGELPPPNNCSHGPLPTDTTTCSFKSKLLVRYG